MRTSVAVVFGVLLALTGWGGRAEAQNAEAFLAGTSKDCPGCNLAGAMLKRRNLTGADLSGANLTGATFHRSNLRAANFSGADRTDANLNQTELLQAMEAQLNRIERMLAIAPDKKGDDYYGDRILEDGPLAAAYLYPEDRLVYIMQVMLIKEKPTQ